jgi:hypothetical protein
MAGADESMNKHMLSLLAFDKNKGFALESGQFVKKTKMHQVSDLRFSERLTFSSKLSKVHSQVSRLKN